MSRYRAIFLGLLLLSLSLFGTVTGAGENPTSNEQLLSREAILILEEIRNLKEDMNKRFEQVDKRFEFIQLLLLALLGVVIGTTLYSILRDRKLPEELRKYIELTRVHQIMLREMIERDPKLLEHFKNIGLL